MYNAKAAEFRGVAPVTPAQLIALRMASLQGLRRHGAAFLLGALAACALPPVDLTPALLPAFSGFVWLWDGARTPRDSFFVGWSFGFGFFMAGLYWIAAALFVDIAQFWWLVPFAAAGLPAGFALFTGGASLAAFLVCRHWHWRGTARILTLCAFWASAEWLRGHILTGFPWNLVGYAWSGGFPASLAVLQTTSVIGIYGLSLVTLVIASLPAALGDFTKGRKMPALVAGALLLLCLGFGALRLSAGTPPLVPGVELRLVQPSIPRSLEETPADRAAHLRTEVALSTEAVKTGLSAVIWPEGGGPNFLDRDPAALSLAAAAAPEAGLAIIGTVRTDPAPGPSEHIWNALQAVDHEGHIVASYDKAHLVPFGEYVPLRRLLPLNKITPGTLDFSAGPGPRTLHLPGLPPVSPLICYEVIFPGATVDSRDRPQWLLTVTDDAWYGFTSGPFQHFDIARVRSVEQGLSLVRVADNGVSGLIDPYGRVLDRMGLNEVGYLDVPLPQALPVTVYARLGDAPFLIALPALIGLAAMMARSRRRAGAA